MMSASSMANSLNRNTLFGHINGDTQQYVNNLFINIKESKALEQYTPQIICLYNINILLKIISIEQCVYVLWKELDLPQNVNLNRKSIFP